MTKTSDWGVKTHSIYAYLKNKTERSIALYESLKDDLTSLFSYTEGKNKLNVLKATYPELSFELKAIGD